MAKLPSEISVRQKLATLPLALLLLVVALNISWPLTSGDDRIQVTVLGVLLFFAESKIHAFVSRGTRFVTTFVLVVLPTAFLVEFLGVHTGWPFGDYNYSEKLGWQLFGVPLLIPLAWFMMMYPCWIIANKITSGRWQRIAIASWLMATWDLYLDPQMVNEGYWLWQDGSGNVTTEIPISNFVGWLLASAFIYLLLELLLPKGLARVNDETLISEQVPYLAVAWVWLGSFVANIGWFGPFLNQPGTALMGLIGMGLVLVPFYWKNRDELFSSEIAET